MIRIDNSLLMILLLLLMMMMMMISVRIVISRLQIAAICGQLERQFLFNL
jgi:hypothetical protein